MPDDFEQQRIYQVRVTNNGDTVFADRCNGAPVTIYPGKSLTIPLEFATHFFGWHPNATLQEMHRYMCKRHGWNTVEYVTPGKDGKTKAERMCEKFLIEPVAYKMVAVDDAPADPNTPIPADGATARRQLGRPKNPATGQFLPKAAEA